MKNALKINKWGCTNETWRELNRRKRIGVASWRSAFYEELEVGNTYFSEVDLYLGARNLTLKTLKEKDWFELIYALCWCRTHNRYLSEWKGMVTEH